MINKYRVHEVAKDFDCPSKEILDIVTKHFEGQKKSMTALEEAELDVIFEIVTQENSVESFDAYFATASTYKFFTLIRALKNIALFLPEAFLLVLFLFAIMPITSRIKLTPQTDAKPEFTRRNIIAVIILLLVSIAAVCFLVYLLHQK